MNPIKELRIQKKLTQQQASELVGISRRSYIMYENENAKQTGIKYSYILNVLKEYNKIDEDHGILSMDDLIDRCKKVLDRYKVNYCYLFGSYAKGGATQTSDVDLLVATSVKGLKFYGMVEDLRVSLNKRVDVLGVEQLNNNPELLNEILKDGIKIYG